MKSVRFHHSKSKLVKALSFRSFHETEVPAAFVKGRISFKYYTEIASIASVHWVVAELRHRIKCNMPFPKLNAM